MLPTDAVTQALLEERFPEGVPETVNVEQERQKINDSLDIYHRQALTRLDRIAHDHPGKLEVVIEAHGPELIDKVRHPINEHAFGVLDRQIGSRGEDLTHEDVLLYTAAVSILAGVNDARDIDKADQIADLAEEDDIFAVVNIEGPMHRSGDRLQADRYNVIQQHVSEGSYYRAADFVREVMADPEKSLNDDIIRQVVTEQTEQFAIEPGDSREVIKRKIKEKISEERKQAGFEPSRIATFEQYVTAKQVLENTLATQPHDEQGFTAILDKINTQTAEGEQYSRDIWRIIRTIAKMSSLRGSNITAQDLDNHYTELEAKATNEGNIDKARGIARRRELVSKFSGSEGKGK